MLSLNPTLSPAVPPNITMQPVALTPDETTTKCCAGIRVFLEDPTDPTIVFTAQVSTDGTPFTDRSVTREGDVVYVEGLQAGTPYNITLTVQNQLGRDMKEVLTTPLIGEISSNHTHLELLGLCICNLYNEVLVLDIIVP